MKQSVSSFLEHDFKDDIWEKAKSLNKLYFDVNKVMKNAYECAKKMNLNNSLVLTTNNTNTPSEINDNNFGT